MVSFYYSHVLTVCTETSFFVWHGTTIDLVFAVFLLKMNFGLHFASATVSFSCNNLLIRIKVLQPVKLNIPFRSLATMAPADFMVLLFCQLTALKFHCYPQGIKRDILISQSSIPPISSLRVIREASTEVTPSCSQAVSKSNTQTC